MIEFNQREEQIMVIPTTSPRHPNYGKRPVKAKKSNTYNFFGITRERKDYFEEKQGRRRELLRKMMFGLI